MGSETAKKSGVAINPNFGVWASGHGHGL